jgi:hypothetical protein
MSSCFGAGLKHVNMYGAEGAILRQQYQSMKMVKVCISDSYEFPVQGCHKNLREKISKLMTANMAGMNYTGK